MKALYIWHKQIIFTIGLLIGMSFSIAPLAGFLSLIVGGFACALIDVASIPYELEQRKP